MALQRLVIDGYGQVELNNVAFRRDGRIEAQCKIASDIDFVENGMLLAVDNVTRTVGYPSATSKLIALNYSAEHMYEERHSALKDFKLERGSFLPRLGYLALGDKFTTNCIAYDDEEFEDEDALIEALEAIEDTALYGVPCENGAICITATGTDAILQVIKYTTMPDGQPGVKFQAIV